MEMQARTWGLILSLIIFFSILLSLKQCAKRVERIQDYKGILTEIFIDTTNRYEKTYRIQIIQGETKVTVRSYPQSFNYIEIGDSIIKKEGELKITIKKKKYQFSRMATFMYE